MLQVEQLPPGSASDRASEIISLLILCIDYEDDPGQPVADEDVAATLADRSDHHLYGIYVDGQLAAAAAARHKSRCDDESVTYISGIAVSPEHRGVGLGYMLIRWIGAAAVQAGDVGLLLYPADAAIPAYARMGFEFTDGGHMFLPVAALLDAGDGSETADTE